MLIIGKIVNTHGIDGEVKIIEETDFPERFTIGNTIYLIKSDEETVPVEIENYRQMNKYGLLKLKGYDDIKHSELLKGLELKIKKEQVDKLPEIGRASCRERVKSKEKDE